MRRTRISAVGAVAALALLAAGCGGSSPDSGSGSDSGRGPIVFASGKDTTGKLPGILDLWNKKHPKEKVTLLELSAQADAQRNSMVQNFQAKSDKYDVVNADVVWTAEFAARGWLKTLDKAKLGGPSILPAVVKTATFDNKLIASPFTSDGGMLYYRKDLVKTPPKTWSEMIKDCAIAKKNNMDCYAGQFSQYEGLTVNADEAIHSAGGDIVTGATGTDVVVDSPEAKKGLEFLVNGFKQGYIPKAAITYTEEEGRIAFQKGKLLFLRNWPYVYNLAKAPGKDSVIQNKFAVAPLPGPNGPGSSTLGGHNLALSAFSKHPDTAQDWMAFMQTPQVQRKLLTDLSLAPVVTSLYDDPKLKKVAPYLPTLKQSILRAKSRPVTANYNEVTVAIEKNVYAALQGQKTVDQALSDLKSDLEEAVKRS